MTPPSTRPSAALSALLAVAALLTACQSGSDAGSDTHSGADAAEKSPSAQPHGYVEGAEEAAEQQSRLVMADAGSGSVRILDLTTGDTTPAGKTPDAQGITTDGRFAFIGTGSEASVVDSGTWTVPHGDHVHYYRAKIRDVGTVPGKAPLAVHSDKAVTAVSAADGTARLYDRTKLEDGSVGKARKIPGKAEAGAVMPYEEHLLVPVPVPGDGGKAVVEVRDRDGGRVERLRTPCPEIRGAAVTRRGVVYACADGALLVTEAKGGFDSEKIAYDAQVDAEERAHTFQHRPGSTTLAARAGDDGTWLLDVTERTWKRVDTGPALAVNTAGEGAPLLALDDKGVLRAYDTGTGKVTARVELMSPPGGKDAGAGVPGASIEIDTSRAYLNDAAGKKVYEIDYNDDLRLARTFPLDFAPTHMVETGR
ncbi:hypothetical protein LHJ74_13205 [Streptomyces sp. N2-109]|uniref:Lipoprotein n=1 Tax=Streptomyces gossypii TaxID=2883101 RepID=A0ABT2JSJ2_9ACTN|nr:hypothetical protein [Streptomyces gossypii]MCT2590856.1 hypothetical protein [Streptomyces gossypii]